MLDPYDDPRDFQKIDEIIREWDDLEKQVCGEITGLRTGYNHFDECTGGFQPSEVIVVSGYPDMKQEVFLKNIAINVAVEQRIPVAYFSLREKRHVLGEQLLFILALVDRHRYYMGCLNEKQKEMLADAKWKLESIPLYVYDKTGLTIPEMKRELCSLINGKPHLDDFFKGRDPVKVGLVIIDHLQLVQSWSDEVSRKDEIRVILDEIKYMAREMQVPFILNSRLYTAEFKKFSWHAEEREPILEDLMRAPETSWIDKYADTIIFVGQKHDTLSSGRPGPDRSELSVRVVKGRYRIESTSHLVFDHVVGRITEF